MKHLPCGRVMGAPDSGNKVPDSNPVKRQNSSYDCIALHCKEPLIIMLPLSQYDVNTVEMNIINTVERDIHVINTDENKINIYRWQIYSTIVGEITTGEMGQLFVLVTFLSKPCQ